jgi:phytoene dehydrogenase-like protein
MSRYDAIIIGASVGGLAAAALLAKGGARVLLLEKRLAPPEPSGPLFALDPQLVESLKLESHGVAFSRRVLGLLLWDAEEEDLLLPHEPRAASRALARLSRSDADLWNTFQSDLAAQGRALRHWWFHPHSGGDAGAVLTGQGARRRFAHDSLMGAGAFLSRSFESPHLIGALLYDALAGGLAPSEPGSALALIWRAAQEMAGTQGAVALAERGSLIAALKAASGGERRFGALVTEILCARGVTGVRLEDGEILEARAVLSSLSRDATERLAGRARPAAARAVGEAQILLSLAEDYALPPALQGNRALLSLTPEDHADAHEAARAGRLPPSLPLSLVAESPRRLVLNLPLAPVAPPGGWTRFQTQFAAAAVRSLRRHLPGLGEALTGVTVTPPRPFARAGLTHLLAPALARAATGVERLYLCGEEAEPVACISGRAGRFAAHFAARALE